MTFASYFSLSYGDSENWPGAHLIYEIRHLLHRWLCFNQAGTGKRHYRWDVKAWRWDSSNLLSRVKQPSIYLFAVSGIYLSICTFCLLHYDHQKYLLWVIHFYIHLLLRCIYFDFAFSLWTVAAKCGPCIHMLAARVTLHMFVLYEYF